MVCRCLAQTLSVFLLLVGTAMAQQGRIRGVVTDQSGAFVPAARVTLTGGRRKTETQLTGPDGSYSFAGLTPGEYTVSALAPQLTLIAPVNVKVGAAPQTINLVLSIVAEKQQVTVEESNKPAVSTEASSNASAMVIRAADLDALSDNTDDLAEISPPSPDLPPDQMAQVSSSTASAAARSRPKARFVKSGSIRIRSRRSSTSSASVESRF